MTDELPSEPLDLTRAYLLLRAMSRPDDDEDQIGARRVADLIAAQPQPEPIMRGLGAVINELVNFVDEAYHMVAEQEIPSDPDEPVRDALHVFHPAIIARLARTPDVDEVAVPVMAGVLTAASMGLNCYEWRSHIGSWHEDEYPAWAFTAWYLCDLVGHVRGQPDFALDMIGTAVADPSP